MAEPTPSPFFDPEPAYRRKSPDGRYQEVGYPEYSEWSEERTARLFPNDISYRQALETANLVETTEAGRLAAERRAIIDSKTELLNMDGFLLELDLLAGNVERHPQPVTVVVIDLDKFKAVNDTLGHQAGDHVLGEVADSLKSTMRPGDVLARLGGDEFGMLLPGTTDAAPALERVSQNLPINPVTAERVGLNEPAVTVYEEDQGRTLRQAFDLAWSQNKS